MDLKQSSIFCFILLIGTNSQQVHSGIVNDDHFENDIIPVDAIKSLVLCSTDGGLTGLMNCAASKALKVLQVASKVKKLEVLPGVVLEGDENVDRNGKEFADEEPPLPTDPEEKSSKLNALLLERVVGFLSGRTLRINLPNTNAANLARALEEGRGKMKKMMGPLMMGIALKVMALLPIILGALAIVSTKALIIAKIALLLTIIIFAQSFFSTGFRSIIRGHGLGHKFNTGTYGGYGPDTSYGAPGWTTTQLGNQYPYKRSIEISSSTHNDDDTAQRLAYSQQKPQEE